jgi:serine protease inhibitor
MNKLILAAICAVGLLSGGAMAQAATSGQTDGADKTACEWTAQLFAKHQKNTNLVFSPYSLQQMMPLIADNTTEKSVQKELKSYIVPGIRTEKLRNTKTGSLILLDKALASSYHGGADGDLHVVAYPDEALQDKLDFQNRILGSVIDSAAPQGNLNFLTAAHYYAEWAKKFDKSLTKKRNFTDENGTVIQAMTMRQHFKSNLGKLTGDYSMTSIWGKHGSVVYFIKPEKDAAMVAKNLDKIIADFDAGKGTVRNIWLEVPKINIKNKLDLKSMLRDMGCTSFFDGSLYFDKISGKQTYVLASASQTATLDVNEEYAEGKALTEMGFNLTAMPMLEREYTILMDHPYFIVVKDRVQGTATHSIHNRMNDNVSRIVFTAWIANPK